MEYVYGTSVIGGVERENLKISNDQYQVGMENLTALLEAQAQWQETWSQ